LNANITASSDSGAGGDTATVSEGDSSVDNLVILNGNIWANSANSTAIGNGYGLRSVVSNLIIVSGNITASSGASGIGSGTGFSVVANLSTLSGTITTYGTTAGIGSGSGQAEVQP
jgi:hypothetical protein